MLYHYQQALNNRQDACSTIHKFCCVFDSANAHLAIISVRWRCFDIR
jgi:hypothetical protein